MPLSMTPGSDHRHGPVLRCRHGLRRDLSSSALPKFPQSASRGARISRLPDSLTLRPASLLAPFDGSDQVSPAPESFYFTTWTGLLVLAGLAPAGMAASLAARRVGSRRGPGFE